ncbi:hypothetical protein VDG1235_210 [Verrucomicrobiia bacterium DG1235]|nr:hypothetical protein VDG1235_210 [Verrucomicrobiae bacterium DG1235]
MAKLRLATILAVLASSSLHAISIKDVWINEIHYDNSGADKEEFVELAVKSGASLSGLELIRVETSSSGNVTYSDNSDLSGLVISNITNGFGFGTVDISGIQNGPNDGLALKIGTSILQFISYEGVLSTNFGILPAPITSVDIGVQESSSNTDQESLQFLGFAGKGTWTGPIQNTKGSVNTGQKLTASSVPDQSSTFSLFGTVFLLVLVLNRKIKSRRT